MFSQDQLPEVVVPQSKDTDPDTKFLLLGLLSGTIVSLTFYYLLWKRR